MGRFENALIRRALKPNVTSDLHGRLRLTFKCYKLLPKDALPYLHYVRDVMTMLPGVTDTQVNPRIGTALISYDPQTTSREQILQWIDAVVSVGLELSAEINWQNGAIQEAELAQLARERLLDRLPK